MSQRNQTEKKRLGRLGRLGRVADPIISITGIEKIKPESANKVNSSSGPINNIGDVKSYRIDQIYKERDPILQRRRIIKLANRLTKDNDNLEDYRSILNEIIDLVVEKAKIDKLNDGNTDNPRFIRFNNDKKTGLLSQLKRLTQKNSQRLRSRLTSGQIVHPSHVEFLSRI